VLGAEHRAVGTAGAALDALLNLLAEFFEFFEFGHMNSGIQESGYRIQEKGNLYSWILNPVF
jgi:hypothetical protein